MMSLEELARYIISGLVEDTSSLEISVNEDEKTIFIDIKIDDALMGRIIGRNGNIINSIRTIMQEASSLRDGKFVKLEVNKEA